LETGVASSNATIWVTLAAAAGTLVIVGGVLGGPAVLRCASAPGGLLACLRGEIVDVGLLPEPKVVAEPAATPVVSPDTPPVEPIPTAPDLTLVRAEPDGQVLIAGTAAPGLAVQVFVNGNLLGVTTAEPSGDWVLAPDTPLPAGTATISVGPPDAKEPRASATVVIAPDKAAPPVVTIGTPVAPTPPMVEQPTPKPSAPATSAPEPEPVAAPTTAPSPRPPALELAPAPAMEVAEAPPPEEEPAEPEATVVETPKGEAPKAAEPKAEELKTEEPKTEEPKTEEPKTEEPKTEEPKTETASPATPPHTPGKPAAPNAAAAPIAPDVAASPPPKETKPVTEATKPEPKAPPVAKPETADKKPATEPKPATTEATQPAKPSVPVRPVLPVEPVKPVSPLAPSTAAGKLAPSSTAPLQVADAPQPTPTPKAPGNIVPSMPAPGPTIDAIEIDGTANFFAGAGPEGATVELFVQDRFIATAKVEGGRWLVEASGALTLPAQRVRVELADAPTGDRSARGEVNFILDLTPPPDLAGAGSGTAGLSATAAADLALPFQPESELEVAIPTLRATPSADPTMLRFSSGKAIIRRGETLWAIATRVYGDGSQYPRIVRANPGLIAQPERIFPGQVFDLPATQAAD
jgi:nucleoid-associated protein YgaU